jgi:hypothetical protein
MLAVRRSFGSASYFISYKGNYDAGQFRKICNLPAQSRVSRRAASVQPTTSVIRHLSSHELERSSIGYSTFKKHKDDCTKIVMKPELN